MARFVVRRLAAAALVLVVVSWLVFLVFTVLPGGDPAERMAGRNATAVQVEAIRREWGFDRSLLVQYGETMKRVATGELVSYANGTNVVDEILKGLPRTLALVGGAAVLWLAFGIALGVYGVARSGRPDERVVMALAVVGMSMPVFWIAALMSHYVGSELEWLPNGGYVEIGEGGVWAWAQHLLLPWTALALVLVGVYGRVLRASLLGALGEDYVRTARAKGLSERRVLLGHALPNAIVPMLTVWGLDVAGAIGGGAILVESVFDLHGVGQYVADAVGDLDVPPILGVTLLAAVAIVVLNAVVDIAQAVLDPRVRTAR